MNEHSIRYEGWRVAAAAGMGVFLPTAVLFVRERPSAISDRRADTGGASVRDGLRSRPFWTVVVVTFCASVAQNAAIVPMPALLVDRGVPAHLSALAMAAMGGASPAGRLFTGWLIDRVFRPRVSCVLLVILALGTFLLASARSFSAGAVAAVLIGFGIGGESDVTPYLLSRYCGLRSLSTLYGFTWIASGFAGAIGPILMGRAFDATGSYEALLVRLAIVTLAAAALMLAMPRYESARSVMASSAQL